MYFLSVLLPLLYLSSALASVTVYSQQPLGATTTAAAAQYTGAAAYDPTVLAAPAIPNPAPSTAFSIQLQSSSSNVQGLSIQQAGDFMGFSVEMSVATQVIGLNSTFLQVPFLNLMAAIKDRAGGSRVRVGGNTQDYAYMVDSITNGIVIEKDKLLSTNPTDTPTLMWTPELIYMLANVTALTNTKWYLGIPLNDSSNFRLQIAEVGDSVLGSNLLGMQVANEPDLYVSHGHRPSTYGPYDYFGEFGTLVQALASDGAVTNKTNLIGPNIATGAWTPEMVWDTGFIPTYSSSLTALAVEHYPSDNCVAVYGGAGTAVDPQTEFPNYLNHTSGYSIVQPYINSTQIAVAAGKPFLMMETNTASCGGFPGISDSFGAALWALDYGLQMAYYNFSGAMLHVGGQNVYYNPFTPPPTNESTFHQWTVGSVFYSALVIAEVFGSSGQSQIVDLYANSNNIFTPAYAIYENGAPSKVALFNYITDPTNATAYTASIQISGGSVPSSVKVKYLSASSVSDKAANITWAGQTFGDTLSSDGRLTGTESVQTVNCDSANNQCQIFVPAPGFALVFLTDATYADSAPSSTETFSTTAVTKTMNTATVAASVLATSNGHSGSNRALGSTSKGSSGAVMGVQVPGLIALLAMTVGSLVVGRAMMR